MGEYARKKAWVAVDSRYSALGVSRNPEKMRRVGRGKRLFMRLAGMLFNDHCQDNNGEDKHTRSDLGLSKNVGKVLHIR